jgi:hypothetical protein
VHEQLAPYLSPVVDLSPVFAWRLNERRSTASVASGISGAPVRLPPDRELVKGQSAEPADEADAGYVKVDLGSIRGVD